jgi:methionine-rich copper-binding protein CopC
MLGAAITTFVLMVSGPSFAHGEFETSDPAKNATLEAVPPEVSVTYTETPAAGAKFVVKDGCGREVGAKAAVEGKALVAQVSGSQPGTWIVEWNVISAEDGHQTKGSLTFKVTGRPDCSGTATSGGGSTSGDEPSSIPSAVFIGVGVGVALVAIAAIIRRSSGS